jgi:putative ABC transport system permease protein
MQTLWQDLRYGARMLLKNHDFTTIAILTLALGIGVNTAIFSVVDAVLLRPLPYQDSDRLVRVWRHIPQTNGAFSLNPANFFALKEQNQSFEAMSAFSNIDWSGNLTGDGEPERLQGCRVSANLFSLLGVQPSRGRAFLPEEEQPGRNQVVLITSGLWQRRFGADEMVIGRSVTLNGQNYTVIGVLPPDFQLAKDVEIWSPLALDAKAKADEDNSYLDPVIARLKPGVTIDQAQAEMNAILRRNQTDQNKGPWIKVVAAQDDLVQEVKRPLQIMLGAVGFILLIACANVANLLLARSASRRQEMAVRLALGASRWRLIRQMLTESLLLGLLGGAAGLIVALWGSDFIVGGLPEYLSAVNPRLKALGIDGRALGFAFAASFLTSVIFGLAPAIQASSLRVNETLKDGGKGTGRGFQGRRLLQGLMVSEVALSLALLIGAALLLTTFWRLSRVNPGFNPRNALTINLSLTDPKYAEAQARITFFEQLLERVRNLPGVSAASAINYLPLAGAGQSSVISVEGRPPQPAGEPLVPEVSVVTPDYFHAVQIPLLKGRFFDQGDRMNTAPVVVVSENLARRLWPGEEPLGKRIKYGGENFNAPWMTVVGVVGDTKHYDLVEEPRMRFYKPYAQDAWNSMTLVVRSEVDASSLSAAVRGEVIAVDGNQPVFGVRTFTQLFSASIARQRFFALLMAAFAGLAMLLAVIGIYGVVAYSVAQRTREIGIRMALGAQARDVLRSVVKRGMALTLVGVAIGLIASFALTRFMEKLLFGVSATDPMTFASIALLLAVVALFACYIPARRATKVDPMVALREE